MGFGVCGLGPPKQCFAHEDALPIAWYRTKPRPAGSRAPASLWESGEGPKAKHTLGRPLGYFTFSLIEFKRIILRNTRSEGFEGLPSTGRRSA